MKAGILRATVAVCLLGAVVATDASAATGDLTQKPGLAGCVSDTGAGPCADGTALDGAFGVTVSPDGKNAYAATLFGNAVDVFDRAPDGTLTQKPGLAACVSDTGAGPCADGTALSFANSVTVSPDGKNVYVSSYTNNSVAVFDRAADGTLTQKSGLAACISDTGSGPCADGTALNGGSLIGSVTVSPDGKNVYVASFNSDAVAVLDRATDGTLTQKPGLAACVSDTGAGPCADGTALDGAISVTVSPDGKSVYVASQNSKAVDVFDRAADGTLTQKSGLAACISDTGAGPCTAAPGPGPAVPHATSLTVSPDGKSVYVSSDNGGGHGAEVDVFDRAADGALTQNPGLAGCVNDGQDSGCTIVRGIFDSVNVVTVSSDGQTVYALNTYNNSVAILRRAADGALTQSPGTAGCIADDGNDGCADLTALDGPRGMTVSPDGKNVYVASQNSAAVAVFDREPDTTPPDTTITSGPAEGATNTSTTPTFTFTSDDAASTFNCQIDGAAAPCTSPFTTPALSNGQHTFAVTATDSAGNPDPTPATRTFTVGLPVGQPPGGQPQPQPQPPVGQQPLSLPAAPVLSAVSLSSSPFRASGARTPRGRGRPRPVGTRVRFRLSEAASVRMTIILQAAGRRVGKRCLTGTRARRHRARCTRSISRGSVTFTGHAGANSVAFNGRVGRRVLSAGAYRATLVATDSGGRRSAARTVSFTIVRR